MCGICGIINFRENPVENLEIKSMMQIMKHRGPDDEGLFVEDSIGLGFVRLSIIDMSPAGHQPMFSIDNRFVIVFNGEIYNYTEIKKELQKEGYKFITQSDSEVLLVSYIHWGEDCLTHLNGMWAFVIYDRMEKTFFASRDRFGIKPFYYFYDENTFIFASEISPIIDLKPQLKKANDQIIYDYLLTNRTNHTKNTFFKDIFKLQHGSNISINLNSKKIAVNKWYSLYDNINVGYNSCENFREDFKSSVNLQLRSDVPIGLCLSGGLDSSSIGSTISKLIGRSDIHSFSAIYGKGKVGDETDFINEFDGYIDNIHFIKPDINSFMSEMDFFVSVMEEPIPGTSEYAEMKVMELAKKYCTVVLNGQGADEYMAGYHYLIGFFLKQKFYELKWIGILNDVYKHYKIHKSFYPFTTSIFYLLPNWLKKSIMYRKNSFINNDFYNEFSHQNDDFIFKELYSSRTLKDSFINHFEYKFEHNLLWADKSGMRFSIETRFPFLDHNLVEKMLKTENKLIYSGGITKIILRDAMKDILPEKVRNRIDKVGFATPEDEWFRDMKFQIFFEELVNSSTFCSRPYFDISKINNLYYNHLKGKNNGHDLWKIVHLELWLRKFIDK